MLISATTKMILFNFDSTSAVVKFETLKIAILVNDLSRFYFSTCTI